MGELRFPGLATGIDTAALIKQIMIINSRRLAKYQLQKTDYEKEITAMEEVRTKVTALESSAAALADADTLEAFNVTSSDTDILTLTTASDAAMGSHSIEIDQLATTEAWIQDISTFNYKTDYVLTDDTNGVFIYSYNNKEAMVTAVKNVTTLEDMVNLINNDEGNPGVTASLVLQGGKYHLMLSGQETGQDYHISVNASSTEVLQADSAFTLASDNTQNAGLTTKITELDEFTANDGLEGDEEIRITGTNRYNTAIPQFELAVTSNTTLAHLLDAIEDAYGGNVKATLESGEIVVTDATSGESELTVSLAYYAGATGTTVLTLPTMAVSTEGGATSGTAESLASLVSTSFIKTQSAQNSKTKIDGYPSGTSQEKQTLTTDAQATEGAFTLFFEGEETSSLDYTATKQQIEDALNALTTITAVGGVTVTVTNDFTFGNGADIDIQFLASAGDVKMISIDKGTLVGPSTFSIIEDTKGNDGWITRNGNSIADALAGITLNLHDVTEVDTPIQITVTRNTGAVSSKVQGMVGAYNALITELKSKTEYDAKTKKMGILSNNMAVSFIKTQAQNPFIGIIEGFTDTIDSFIQARDIGITIDGAGMMQFDTDEFNDAANEDFAGILELLGATKTGNSSNTAIGFYDASDKYTTAGTYNVKVTVAGNLITSAKIKLSTESTYRDVNWLDSLITCPTTFDGNGNPIFPENGLQLNVDLTNNGDFTATVNVKQGMAGALEDLLDQVVKVGGRLDTSEDIIDDRITAMTRRIENEENRLNGVETRLIDKYARLEKTLSMMQQQMGAVSMVSAATFGS